MTSATTTEARNLVQVELAWEGDLRFRARAGEGQPLVLDSDGVAGPSPVQALVMALASCMGMDLVHILRRGRQPITGLSARVQAVRSPTDPRKVLRVELAFRVEGEVEADKIERAIALSRDTYCSVWHSLRPDIEFATSLEAGPPTP